MKLWEILSESSERATDPGYVRALKKVGDEIKLQYRCTRGSKKGDVVASPKTCFKRKSIKRMLAGRKVNLQTRAQRNQKGLQTRRTAKSKRLRAWNKVID